MKNPTPNESPIYLLLNEIKAAVRNGAPFLAITMAVALPDMCASLESDDGRTSLKKYKIWCQENLDWNYFSYIGIDDLYSMRCGVLHNGKLQGLKNDISRVLFALPNQNGMVFVNNRVGDAYFYSVLEFCDNICDSVYRWYEKNGGGEIVQNNVKSMMQYHFNGVSPYVVGIPVLA